MPPGLARAVDRQIGARGARTAFATVAPPALESYCMVASFMSLEVHERGNHVVFPGGGPVGGSGRRSREWAGGARAPGVRVRTRTRVAGHRLTLSGAGSPHRLHVGGIGSKCRVCVLTG